MTRLTPFIVLLLSFSSFALTKIDAAFFCEPNSKEYEGHQLHYKIEEKKGTYYFSIKDDLTTLTYKLDGKRHTIVVQEDGKAIKLNYEGSVAKNTIKLKSQTSINGDYMYQTTYYSIKDGDIQQKIFENINEQKFRYQEKCVKL